MKIAKTTLTDTHLIITLSGGSAENRYDVRAVYIDKASNYGNAYSSQANKHTWVPEYTTASNIIKITIPTYAPTYFTFTIVLANEILLGMYLNEFSLFKAKSKYLLAFDGCCNCGHSSICVGCDEKKKRYRAITYMLRLNLFYQSYINGNVQLAAKYYEDARRIYDMDEIQFEYLDFTGAGDPTSPNLYKLFDKLNTWIKNNSTQCEKQVLEALLIDDLYSLLFAGVHETGGSPEIPDDPTPDEPTTQYMYYGYLAMADVADFKTMRDTTHDFSLLKAEEVLAGVTSGKVHKETLVSKQFNLDIPIQVSCLFVLIPETSSKKATIFDGISQFIKFSGTSSEHGFDSNGENRITIDGVTYKIYGENSVISAERTLKIS